MNVVSGIFKKKNMPQLSQSFFQKILFIEAGYQKLSDDKGNIACGILAGTNRGVSAIAYQEYTGRCPSVADMESIDDAFAWDFYNWFWNRFRIDEIEDTDVANLVMNNFMGAPKYAAQSLQRAMNRFGYGLAVDGIIGSKTLTAVNHAVSQNKPASYNAIRDEWIDYLRGVTYGVAITRRVNTHFPPMQVQTQEVVAGGIGLQEARIKTMIRAARKGNWRDIATLSLILIGLIGLILLAGLTIRKM